MVLAGHLYIRIITVCFVLYSGLSLQQHIYICMDLVIPCEIDGIFLYFSPDPVVPRALKAPLVLLVPLAPQEV